MNYNMTAAAKAKDGGNRLTAGIKKATFQGIQFETKTSQQSGDTFKVMTLNLDVEGFGPYSQSFFEPQSDERKQMSWGIGASPQDHFIITVRQILEALDPQIIEDLNNGTKTLSAPNFKQFVDKVKAFSDPYIGSEIEIKLIPDNKGYNKFPAFPARITASGDLGIATRIIGHDLTLTPKEETAIKNAAAAKPTNMASVAKGSEMVDAMKASMDDLDDLPF